MPLLRLAVASQRFALPPKEAIRAAASMGVSGVQFDVRQQLRPADLSETGRRHFLHGLDEAGLQVASLHFPTRHSLYDQEELEARVAACREAMDFAAKLKAKVVTVRAGRVPDDEGSPEFQILRDVLTDLARHGNMAGVVLALTPTRDDPQRLGSLLKGITSGPIGVNFDPATFVMSGHAPVSAFAMLRELVAHFTVRDALQDIDGAGVEVAVGRGEVPWDEMLALVQEADYRGWMTIDRTQGDDKPGDMARAAKYLGNVMLG